MTTEFNSVNEFPMEFKTWTRKSSARDAAKKAITNLVPESTPIIDMIDVEIQHRSDEPSRWGLEVMIDGDEKLAAETQELVGNIFRVIPNPDFLKEQAARGASLTEEQAKQMPKQKRTRLSPNEVLEQTGDVSRIGKKIHRFVNSAFDGKRTIKEAIEFLMSLDFEPPRTKRFADDPYTYFWEYVVYNHAQGALSRKE